MFEDACVGVPIPTGAKEAIAGAEGTDFPLVLGSGSFIPGFEPEIVGLKPGSEKTFTVTFPKDYGAASLQNRKVTFTVTVKKVHELTEPKLDDAFAAKMKATYCTAPVNSSYASSVMKPSATSPRLAWNFA